MDSSINPRLCHACDSIPCLSGATFVSRAVAIKHVATVKANGHELCHSLMTSHTTINHATTVKALDKTDGTVNHARNLDFSPVDVMTNLVYTGVSSSLPFPFSPVDVMIT
jgi:hypothetical protein